MRCGTAILLALAALTSAHQQPAMLAALPEPYHRQLLSFHASSKANGGDKKWTLDEDAEILVTKGVTKQMRKLQTLCIADNKLTEDGKANLKKLWLEAGNKEGGGMDLLEM